jgi:hypothetical protein
MPKLDGTHLPERLAKRLADLKAGEEVAAKDIRALLSDEQVEAMNAAWAEQQELRKGKRAKTKEEEKELGWKSKREVHIEAYEKALAAADAGLADALTERQDRSESRAAKIYLDAYFDTHNEGGDKHQSHAAAQNKLKQAHLAAADNERVSARDRDVRAMEEALRAQIRESMSVEELELLEEHEAAVRKVKKSRGKP